MNLQAALYVLEEVELLVAGSGPKIVAHYYQAVFRFLPASLVRTGSSAP
jgi:hypothetical protein